ncbi:dihydrolipoamide acetyltransferase family protein [Sporolactobacillus sp. Y61]|uniref:Dihydrolipoamide acetyltransferase component of pyruvate dehydrogenase complex n=1 Tax=Sporolactobacillus sp. Y61 TaxID=3160863 RepID=A0AAU8IEG3_9BACL
MNTRQMEMPQLGESVTEGTINQWLVSAGDQVSKYDPIAEVTTDKVNAEIPSSFSGTISALLVDEGDTLPVGQPICTIEVEGTVAGQQLKEGSSSAGTDGKPEDGTMKKRYSPAVLKLAQDNDVALEQLTGSGRGGRITRKDVEKYITSKTDEKRGPLPEKKMAQSFSTAPSQGQKVVSASPVRSDPGDIDVPLTAVRKTIAHNMVRSKHEIPHAWTMIEVDVTNLVNYRNQVKNIFHKKEGAKLTFLPFFIKTIVAALKEYPRMNSTWAGDKIIEKQSVNISLAVASDDALYVPVIQHADELSIKGLATAVDDLARRTRENRLTPDDMQGGTFTVNNTGSFGSIQSQPIINYPQAAILSIESIVKRPVVVNNMIAIRDMVNLCISIDHRVLDGLITGQFLARIKERLENISPENTPIY